VYDFSLQIFIGLISHKEKPNLPAILGESDMSTTPLPAGLVAGVVALASGVAFVMSKTSIEPTPYQICIGKAVGNDMPPYLTRHMQCRAASHESKVTFKF
jgi:hypothetical protein